MDRTRTDVCSPPGRGWGWVGSWKAACASHSSPNHAAKPHGIVKGKGKSRQPGSLVAKGGLKAAALLQSIVQVVGS